MNTSADDAREISELVLRFADSLTRGDPDAFARLWAPSGTWRIGPPADFRIDGAPGELRDAVAVRMQRWQCFIQLVHGTVADVAGDSATARSYLSELGKPAAGDDGYTNHGMYVDRLVRTGEGWRFTERTYSYLYIDRSPLKGRAFPPHAPQAGR